MIRQLHNFKVVVIDYPILCFDDERCSGLLGKALKMKHQSYGATYGEEVLPMDQTDFFATHIILCEEFGGNLTPIFAFKSTPLSRCLKYRVEFTPLALLRNDGDPNCYHELQEFIKGQKDYGQVAYGSSWAQNIAFRNAHEPELKERLRELTGMLVVAFHQEYGRNTLLACGVPKVKTDVFLKSLGLKQFSEDAFFQQKSINDEEVVLLHCSKFSDYGREMLEKHPKMWKNKIVIGGAQNERIRKAA